MKSRVLNILIISFVIVSSIFLIIYKIRFIQFSSASADYVVNKGPNPIEFSDLFHNGVFSILKDIFLILFFVALILYLVKSDITRETKNIFMSINIPLIGLVILMLFINLIVHLSGSIFSYWGELADIFAFSVFLTFIVFLLYEMSFYDNISRILLIVGLGLSFVTNIITYINANSMMFRSSGIMQSMANMYRNLVPISILSIISYAAFIAFGISKALKLKYEY